MWTFELSSFDLHVLCAPPAFILSQDQTLLFLVYLLWLFLIYLNNFLQLSFLALNYFLAVITHNLIAFSKVSLNLLLPFLIVLLSLNYLVLSKVYCLLFNVLLFYLYRTHFIVLLSFLKVNTFLWFFRIYFLLFHEGKKYKLVVVVKMNNAIFLLIYLS